MCLFGNTVNKCSKRQTQLCLVCLGMQAIIETHVCLGMLHTVVCMCSTSIASNAQYLLGFKVEVLMRLHQQCVHHVHTLHRNYIVLHGTAHAICTMSNSLNLDWWYFSSSSTWRQTKKKKKRLQNSWNQEQDTRQPQWDMCSSEENNQA